MERSEQHRLQAAGRLAHPLAADSHNHAPPASQARPGSEGSDRFRQVQIGQPWPLEVQKGSERFRNINMDINIGFRKVQIGSERFR